MHIEALEMKTHATNQSFYSMKNRDLSQPMKIYPDDRTLRHSKCEALETRVFEKDTADNVLERPISDKMRLFHSLFFVSLKFPVQTSSLSLVIRFN
jgi:gamma-glutamyl phosphate reductase